MPELPEVEVTRLSFEPSIRGATILSASLGKPLRWPLGIAPQQLVGQQVLGVRRRGTYLLIDLSDGLLLLHLGAVAKHQILDKDEVLGHMAPGAKPGFKEPRAWLAAAGLIAVVAAGYLYTPAVKPKGAPAVAEEPADAEAPAAPAVAGNVAVVHAGTNGLAPTRRI